VWAPPERDDLKVAKGARGVADAEPATARTWERRTPEGYATNRHGQLQRDPEAFNG
jgi:hypothetical protein